MDAETQSFDLDIGPAVAKLRFFRFAEYVLVYMAIAATAWLIGLFSTPADLEALEAKFGFSESLHNLCLALLAVLIFVGILAYRAAGRLRAGAVRRHLVLLPIAAISLLVAGVLFGVQAEGLMRRASLIRSIPAPSVFQQFDPMFQFDLSHKSKAERDRILAELNAKIQREAAAKEAKAAALEAVAIPALARSEFSIGAGIICVLGLWGLLKFARAKLDARATAMTYLDAAARACRETKPPRVSGRPISRMRGFLFLFAAISLMVGQAFLPGGMLVVSTLAAILLSAVAFLALFRAKQYFQISADSLLDKDKRAPILFLRSFSDDPKVNAAAGISHEGLAQLIDFSVETRLANHFMRFGPFITVGSPQDKVPQIGAARVKLADDEWQGAVTKWMETSSAIVMYAGTTHWVGWELKRIIDGGWTGKLILLFPPVLPFPGFWQRSWLKRQKPDILKRFETTKAAFAGTKWEGAFDVPEPETIICARFDAEGGIAFIRSGRRSKDAYDLSAEIAHLGLLGSTSESELNRKGLAPAVA